MSSLEADISKFLQITWKDAKEIVVKAKHTLELLNQDDYSRIEELKIATESTKIFQELPRHAQNQMRAKKLNVIRPKLRNEKEPHFSDFTDALIWYFSKSSTRGKSNARSCMKSRKHLSRQISGCYV